MSATIVDLLTAIESRASALKLMEPGPTRAHLEQIMPPADVNGMKGRGDWNAPLATS